MLGNDKPRSGGSATETKRIKSRLNEHARLMAEYERKGMSRDDASKQAFKDVTRAAIAKAIGK